MFNFWFKWKMMRDRTNESTIFQNMRRFYIPNNRKDTLVRMLVDEYWTLQELEELSNMLGREAHERARYNLT